MVSHRHLLLMGTGDLPEKAGAIEADGLLGDTDILKYEVKTVG